MFALQDIARGSCVFTVKPLLSLEFEEDVLKSNKLLYPRLEKLKAQQLADFEALGSKPHGIDSTVIKEIKSQLAVDGKTRHELAVATVKELKARRIFSNNCMNIDNRSTLFLTYSRINHSCVPNVHVEYNYALGELTVFAVRDIKKDEEIFTQYIELLRTRSQRAAELMAWRFVCDCEACQDESGVSDRRRGRLGELEAMNFSPSEALGEEMIKLMEEEGIKTMELTKACVNTSKSWFLGSRRLANAFQLCLCLYLLYGQSAHGAGSSVRDQAEGDRDILHGPETKPSWLRSLEHVTWLLVEAFAGLCRHRRTVGQCNEESCGEIDAKALLGSNASWRRRPKPIMSSKSDELVQFEIAYCLRSP